MTDQEMMNQLESMKEAMLNGFAALTEKIDSVEQRMTEKIDGVEQRMTEKIDGVEQRMTEKIDGVEQRMTDRQNQFEEHMLEEFRKVMETMDARFSQQDQKLAESIHEVKVYMELAVGNRVSALYEGYEIEHSHRVGLERDSRWMQRQLEDIRTRLSLLENKETA